MKNQNTAVSWAIGLGSGLAVGTAITIIGCILMTFLISGEKMSQDAVVYSAPVTWFTAAVCASAVSMLRVKQMKLPVSLAAGAVYWLSLLAMNGLFFDGQYTSVAMSALVVMGGSGAVALLTLRTGGVRMRRRVRYRG